MTSYSEKPISSKMLLALILLLSWATPSEAKMIRGAGTAEKQKHRELFGQRLYLGRGSRGGEGGAAKESELLPMRQRISVAAPTSGPVPTAPTPPPTTSNDMPTTNTPTSVGDGGASPTGSRSGLCRFENEDGTVREFFEGQSMGRFYTLEGCSNGRLGDFPCICIPSAEDQAFCPYCQFVDANGATICASNVESVTFDDPDSGLSATCKCDISAEELNGSFTMSVSSSCDVDSTINPGLVSPTSAPVTATEAPSSSSASSNSVGSSAAPTVQQPVITKPEPTARPTSGLTAAPTQGPTLELTSSPTASPTQEPTSGPTSSSTAAPTQEPTSGPTSSSSAAPTQEPTSGPTSSPTAVPTQEPTSGPTSSPTAAPTQGPTMGPTAKPTERSATFRLGLLNKVENGLLLSEGLSSRIIANSNQRVRYGDGSVSVNTFHTQPGGGDCFEDISPNNQDGWILLSGSDQTEGGVGAITFNAQGLAIKYEMIFEGSSNNALGGKTIGEFWVTGEKDAETLNGMVYQIDPFGRYEPTIIEAFTEEGGAWQGFAYDENTPTPTFYMSEDFFFGCIRRFTPNFASEDPWNMLLTPGVTDYLLLSPDGGSRNSSSGTFTWTNQLTLARGNAARNYPEAQGVTLDGNILSFVCRSVKRLFRLNLEDMSYTMTSTVGGLFDGDPNEIKAVRGEETLLYMTEIGGRRSGLHVRTQNGEVYTVLEGYSRSHSAGFALSPDGMHMYLTFKNQGTVFDIVRDDGLSFYDELTLDGTGEARNDRTYIKPTTSDVIDVSP